MPFIIAVIMISVFAIGIRIGQFTPRTNEPVNPKPTQNISPTATMTPDLTIAPTNTPEKISLTPTMPSKPTVNTTETNQFIYPGSTVLTAQNNSIHIQSSDDTKKITDWYKTLLQQRPYNTRSFVQTNTNNHILNKLVAANGNQEIRVEITNTQKTMTDISVSW